MYRYQIGTICLSIALASCVGCASAVPTSTSPSTYPATGDVFAPVGMVVRESGIVESAIGRGLLTLDAESMTATWESLPLRVGQDNDAVYALSVNEFLKPVDASIRAFRRTADGFEIDYEFTHPFKSSEISNRADLGFSGMFMLGVTPVFPTNYTWFKDDTDLITDPRWITNPDGYYQPKGLVDTSGIPGNAFPYQLLIDERGTGNRMDATSGTSISNGGSPTGNFTAPDGWQTGDSRSWTGYGVIHQGQKIRNTFAVDGDQLTGVGSLPIITVLLAKYADPKSASPGFEHRLPATPPDVVGDFGYRMPHGALDVAEATFIGATNGWLPNVQSTNTLGFHVVDWDARASETAEADLRNEPDATKVRQGESGTPALALCIPGVLGDRTTVVELPDAPTDDDSAYGGDTAQDSGAPGDELFYAVAVEKPAGSGQTEGDYLGWLRVTDVEVDTQDDYLVALNDDLTPISGDFPVPVTYHPFTVRMGASCLVEPAGIGWATGYGSGATFESSPYAVRTDSAGNVYAFGDFLQEIDLGGGVLPGAGSQDWYLVKFSPTGEYLWGKTWGGTQSEYGRAMVIDGQDRIWLGGSHSGTFDLGGGPLAAVTQNDLVLARFDSDGNHLFSAQFGTTGFSWLTNLSLGAGDAIALSGYSTGTVDLGAGPLVNNGGEDLLVAVINTNGSTRWSQMIGGVDDDRAYQMSLDSDGIGYVSGEFSGAGNFGVSTPASAGDTDAYLLKVASSSGSPVWVNTFGDSSNDRGWRVGVDELERITIAGHFEGTVDLGGAPLTGPSAYRAVFLGQFDADGSHRWSQAFSDSATDLSPGDLAVNAGGDMMLVGGCYGTVSFGGPPLFGNNSPSGYLVRFDAVGNRIWDGLLSGNAAESVSVVHWTNQGYLLHAGIYMLLSDLDPSCLEARFTARGGTADAYVSRMTAEGHW